MVQNSAFRNGLSVEQLNAIDLLVTGMTDAAVAEAVGVHRNTVARWRRRDPWFQAELNRRRDELWITAIERLRGMLPKALDALDAKLAAERPRVASIASVIKLTGLSEVRLSAAPTDPQEILYELVDAKWRELDRERRQSLTPLQWAERNRQWTPERDARERQEALDAVLRDIQAARDEEPPAPPSPAASVVEVPKKSARETNPLTRIVARTGSY